MRKPSPAIWATHRPFYGQPGLQWFGSSPGLISCFKTEYAGRIIVTGFFVYSFFAEHFFHAAGLLQLIWRDLTIRAGGDSPVTSGPIYPRRSSPGHRFARAASLTGTFNLVGDRLENFF